MPEPVQRSRLRRFFRALSRVIAVLLVLGLIAAGLGYRWLDQTVLANLPTDLSSLRDFRPLTSVRVFARDGSQVDEFYLERRVWVPIDELPEHVWRAFLVAEDRRFFEHEGVDFLGIGRATTCWAAAAARAPSRSSSSRTCWWEKRRATAESCVRPCWPGAWSAASASARS